MVPYSTDTMTVQSDDWLDPSYVADLPGIALAEVRSRRAACDEVENEFSYLRRIIQGRLDIVLDEQRRRRAGEGGSDVASLVERLPEILAPNVHAPGLGRLNATLAPAHLGPEATRRLDAIAPADRMVLVGDLPDDELDGLVDALDKLEKEVSAERHALHGVLGDLQVEIIRRYRSGEATVDSLLQ